MTPSHTAWVKASQPAAPEALVARVGEVLGAHAEWERLPLAEALSLAGEELLAGVMARGEETARDRAAALDLLAADACVTWAFEASSDDIGALPERARALTARILSSGAAS